MIRKDITFVDLEDNEQSETVHFKFTLQGIKNFEQLTGQNFYDSFSKAFNKLFSLMKQSGISDKAVTAENLDDVTKILPLISDSSINEFIINFVQGFYGKIEGGKFIQNDFTAEEAGLSDWIIELVNSEFLMEIFAEVNKNNKAPKKSQNLAKP